MKARMVAQGFSISALLLAFIAIFVLANALLLISIISCVALSMLFYQFDRSKGGGE